MLSFYGSKTVLRKHRSNKAEIIWSMLSKISETITHFKHMQKKQEEENAVSWWRNIETEKQLKVNIVWKLTKWKCKELSTTFPWWIFLDGYKSWSFDPLLCLNLTRNQNKWDIVRRSMKKVWIRHKTLWNYQ